MAQVVETSVTVKNNSSLQDYIHRTTRHWKKKTDLLISVS